MGKTVFTFPLVTHCSAVHMMAIGNHPFIKEQDKRIWKGDFLLCLQPLSAESVCLVVQKAILKSSTQAIWNGGCDIE